MSQLPSAARPQWQQTTALITLGAGGVMTGLSLVPQAKADLTSPASLPIGLLAMQRADATAPGADGMLRAGIVHVARHFLRLAETRSPAEMEALIWQYASADGADHGPSCAAFASLTLELGSRLAGQESWVTGGTSYPWPLHPWADARVDPNPASPGVVSVQQDAQAHGRWHPLGDGYSPKPGDWVLFDGHVEVVTAYQGGVLHTVGGDSVPNLSVNAHEYPGALQGQGVAGFVDNGLIGPAARGSRPVSAGGARGVHAGSGDLASSFGVSGAAAPTPPGFSIPAASPGGADRATANRPASAGPPPRGADARHGAPGQGRPAGQRASTASGAGADAGAQAGPVPPADAAPFRPAPAPRAVHVTPAVPRSPYGGLSRALAAQGGRAPADAGPGSAAPPAPRTAIRVPAPGRPEQPHQQGLVTPGAARRPGQASAAGNGLRPAGRGRANVPGTGLRPVAAMRARPGEAAIPGLFTRAHHRRASAPALAPYHRHDAPLETPQPGTAAERAFIQEVAAGAMASQRRYGVPASVTIAQAIDESGWGQSVLATSDRNLFGIKGTGPAGFDVQPTQEVINGSVVSTSASFRVYRTVAESIDAHGRLLARSGYYAAAMSMRHDPNAFAAALTGVYATDPGYGAKLVQLMQQYHLYRYDAAAAAGPAAPGAPGGAGDGGRGGGAAATAAQGPGSPGAVPAVSTGGSPKPGSADIPGIGPRPAHPGREARPGRAAHPAPAAAGHAPGPAPGRGTTPSTGQADLPGAPRVPQADLAAQQGQARLPDPVANPAPVPVPGRSARPIHLPHPAAPARGAVPGRTSGPVRASGNAQQPVPDGAPGGAAIPGLPHAGAAQPRPGQPRSELRYVAPARPAATIYRSGPGASARSARGYRAAGPGSGRAAGAGTRRPGELAPAGAPGSRPSRTGYSAAVGTPHRPAPEAHQGAPAGGASIPGVRPRPVHATTVAAPGPAYAPAPAAGTTAPGDAAIPGVRQLLGNGRAARAQEPRAGAATVSGARTARGATGAARRAPADGSGAPRTAGAPPGSGAAPVAAATATTTAAVFAAAPAGPAPAVRGPAGGPQQGSGGRADATLAVYQAHLPPPVLQAFGRSAKPRLIRAEPLYVDVARHAGLRWEILAACDWMQCRARHGHSPVYGERLGALNEDGTCYRTRSAALERCAYDLVELARSVYQLDIATRQELSVRDLANVFAAFRWGGLLRQHSTSALDFPYSVAGLTADHMHMRWPNIDEPDAPDKPGRRFSQPFGAVPVMIGLNYQALA